MNLRSTPQNEKLDVANRYMGKMKTTFLKDPLGYMINVPTRNKSKAIQSLQARLDRLIATPERDDTTPYDPNNPTLTHSAKKAQIQGLGAAIANMGAQGAEITATNEFKRDFIAWMMGKGKEEHHRKTPWYRNDWMMRTLPDVQNMIDGFVDVIYETEAALTKLILRPPRNLRDCEAYFKYVVDMDWMRRDDSFFFVDMIEFINGGKMGGGLTEEELERFNIRQTVVQRNADPGKKVKWNSANKQATVDDVFKLDEETINQTRGVYDEPLMANHQLIVDDRGRKVNVEGTINKIEALHNNITQTRTNVKHDATDDKGRPTAAGVLMKNYQTPTRQIYNETAQAWNDFKTKPDEYPTAEGLSYEQANYDHDVESPWSDSEVQELRKLLILYLDPYEACVWTAFNDPYAMVLRQNLEAELQKNPHTPQYADINAVFADPEVKLLRAKLIAAMSQK